MTNVIILGDFNLPLIDWTNNASPVTQQYNSFNECISENALTQHVVFPTRGNNTLDLILTVDPLNVTQVKAVSNFQFLDNISDHVAIVFSVNSLDNAQPTTQNSESHYDFRHADILSLKYLLSDIKWEELLSDSPAIDDMLTSFLDIFFSVGPYAQNVCLPIGAKMAILSSIPIILLNYAENVYVYRKESIYLMACVIGGLRIMNTCWLFSGSLTIECAPYYSQAIRQLSINM